MEMRAFSHSMVLNIDCLSAPHLVEVYEIRVNGIADGITEMANKNGIGVKRGNLRNWPYSGLKFGFPETMEQYSAA